MTRIVLFLATNLAILFVLNISLRLLGVDRMLETQGGGINMTALLVMSAAIGMGGAFISLAISKWMAKRSTGARVIEGPRNRTERWLLDTVARQARQAGIGMPEVAIYEAPEINAFATGMNRNNALVAVSTGLLANMSADEAEAVLGHEVSHVANGDMVTLTLVQGVVNTFVILLSRVVGHVVDRVVFRNARGLRAGLLHRRDRRAGGALGARVDDRDVVLPPARVPGRRRRGGARGPPQDDRGAQAAALGLRQRAPAPERNGGVRHLRARGKRFRPPLPQPPAARRPHRGAGGARGLRRGAGASGISSGT